ncbi:MAG: hypothetical protein ACE5LD_02590 [Candidatus Bipolaricaulia bacterium]
MELTKRSQELLEKAVALLPEGEDEVIFRGVTTSITERLVELKRAARQFEQRHGSIEALERRIEVEGLSPDDHTLYQDLLEWRAIRHELARLLEVLESL